MGRKGRGDFVIMDGNPNAQSMPPKKDKEKGVKNEFFNL